MEQSERIPSLLAAQTIAQQDPFEPSNEKDAEDSTDEELAEYFCDNDSEESPNNAELKRVLSQMEDVLDCLMRLAITISNPAPYDQFRSRAGVLPYPDQWDIAHVQQKFPHIGHTISERLGKALTHRRQYFKYREEHYLRLQEGLNGDDDDSGSKGKGTTIASSLPHDCRDTAPETLRDAEDAYSEVSTISYATTSADEGQIRVPPIPKEYESGPFMCPFCYMLIAVDCENNWKARLEWKKHVYRDLHPYVCLEKSCTEANQDFQKRKQWAHHMVKEHWRTWKCPFGCLSSFKTSTESRSHALAVHPTQVSVERVEDLVVLSSNIDLTRAQGKCPLCLTFDIKNSRMYESHIGKHLEQLSLFALPQIDGDESEQDDDMGADRDSDRETDSSEKRTSDVESETAGEAIPGPELETESDFRQEESYFEYESVSNPEPEDFSPHNARQSKITTATDGLVTHDDAWETDYSKNELNDDPAHPAKMIHEGPEVNRSHVRGSDAYVTVDEPSPPPPADQRETRGRAPIMGRGSSSRRSAVSKKPASGVEDDLALVVVRDPKDRGKVTVVRKRDLRTLRSRSQEPVKEGDGRVSRCAEEERDDENIREARTQAELRAAKQELDELKFTEEQEADEKRVRKGREEALMTGTKS